MQRKRKGKSKKIKIENFIFPTQEKLFTLLTEIYKGKETHKEGGYILVKGNAPVLLVAHLDTVHQQAVKTIIKRENGNILSSPQGIGGDDRCGVYALNEIYRRLKADEKPYLLFTCYEEVGGIGANMFAHDYNEGKIKMDLSGLKFAIEIDRKGKNDAVYYSCANAHFENYITAKGFKTEIGSYSDICDIAPALSVAAVNLSSGYYNPHTKEEYIDLREIEIVIQKVCGIIRESTDEKIPRYEYVEGFLDEIYPYYNYDYYDYAESYVNSDNFTFEEKYNALIGLGFRKRELEAYMDEIGSQAIDYLFDEEVAPYFLVTDIREFAEEAKEEELEEEQTETEN